jgi:hypothetical protein
MSSVIGRLLRACSHSMCIAFFSRDAVALKHIRRHSKKHGFHYRTVSFSLFLLRQFLREWTRSRCPSVRTVGSRRPCSGARSARCCVTAAGEPMTSVENGAFRKSEERQNGSGPGAGNGGSRPRKRCLEIFLLMSVNVACSKVHGAGVSSKCSFAGLEA